MEGLNQLVQQLNYKNNWKEEWLIQKPVFLPTHILSKKQNGVADN